MIDASHSGERIHFVTGKLSEHALRNMLERLAGQIGFQPTVQVLNITVAALMTTDWIARRIEVPEGTDRVVIPGLCKGDMALLEQKQVCLSSEARKTAGASTSGLVKSDRI